MRCFLCRAKGTINLQKGRDVCNRCFCMLFEKRIRKNARINKLFREGDKIKVKGELNKYLLKSILKDMPVKFVTKGANKEVIQWSLDDEINEFLKALFKGKKVKKISKKYIKLLKSVTDKEIKIFAKIKKIKFTPNKKDKDVQKFLDEVEKKHPNIKYNLLKNVEGLEKIK